MALKRGRVPVHLLGGIVCFGALGVSPPLMGHCAERGVCISMLSRSGRFLARVEGPVSGNVLLRRAQYRTTDDTSGTAAIVSNLVTGKILNQRTVVRRALRDHGASTPGVCECTLGGLRATVDRRRTQKQPIRSYRYASRY